MTKNNIKPRSVLLNSFIVLLSFSSSLECDQTKCLFLNDKSCIVRPTLIGLNPVEFKYYPFMISLDKCSESFNDLSPRICVLKETKDINVKAFNMITNKAMQLKQWKNTFYVIVNANAIVQLAIQITNRIITHVNVNIVIIIST